ncbi:MAG: Rrf2 family transcriptional regulator [Balneolales bacterium]|nr:Rrf2 family transcriptional regulator [Balneolales bacterium]
MILSKACTYGLLASFYVAKKSDSSYVSIREMSDDLNISFHFLTKILQKLTAAGLMNSHKGPKGGISLTREARLISLKEVILAIDGDTVFTECILGLPGCGHQKPCPIHHEWAPVRDNFLKMVANRSLADSAEGINNLRYRIKME